LISCYSPAMDEFDFWNQYLNSREYISSFLHEGEGTAVIPFDLEPIEERSYESYIEHFETIKTEDLEVDKKEKSKANIEQIEEIEVKDSEKIRIRYDSSPSPPKLFSYPKKKSENLKSKVVKTAPIPRLPQARMMKMLNAPIMEIGSKDDSISNCFKKKLVNMVRLCSIQSFENLIDPADISVIFILYIPPSNLSLLGSNIDKQLEQLLLKAPKCKVIASRISSSGIISRSEDFALKNYVWIDFYYSVKNGDLDRAFHEENKRSETEVTQVIEQVYSELPYKEMDGHHSF